MKTCEAVEGTIHEVRGYRINLGPIKLFPILGSEIPVEERGINTQIGLTEDWNGESGIFAEMVDPQTVALFRYSREVVKEEQPIHHLVGDQINKNPLAKGHLRWVKDKVPHFYTEAAQMPGSTL